MSREKANYRDTLSYLREVEKAPFSLNKTEAAKLADISREELNELIANGIIKMSGKKIPLGSVASYICG